MVVAFAALAKTECLPPSWGVVLALAIGGYAFFKCLGRCLVASTARPTFVVMGPGFNISEKALNYVHRLSDAYAIPGPKCVGYSPEVWARIHELYPPVLQDLLSVLVVNFWFTRDVKMVKEREGIMSSAFTNQFGLNAVCTTVGSIVDFELYVLRRFLQSAQNRGEDISVWCSCMCEAIEHLRSSHNVESALKGVCAAYADNVLTWSHLVNVFADVLRCVILEKSGNIREYDYHVTFTFMMDKVSSKGTKKLFTSEAHVILHCLRIRNDRGDKDEETHKFMVSLASDFKTYMSARGGGMMKVLHDLGLDPMIDDYLAMVFIYVLSSLSETLHILEFVAVGGSDEDRVKRHLLTKDLFPGMKSSWKYGTTYKNGEFFIPNAISVDQGVLSTELKNPQSRTDVAARSRNLYYLIGHMGFGTEEIEGLFQ